jgi:hypothetical protein
MCASGAQKPAWTAICGACRARTTSSSSSWTCRKPTATSPGTYFPSATIVADRFHVIRLVNQHFLNAWKDIHPEGRRNRGLLSLMRRHTWRLKPEQRENLQRYLGDYPVLAALYEAKQRLIELLLLKNLRKKTARQEAAGAAGTDRAAASQPAETTGENPDVLARAHRHDVACQQEQWAHGRLPHQDGDDDP